jgi:hypothetical protein
LEGTAANENLVIVEQPRSNIFSTQDFPSTDRHFETSDVANGLARNNFLSSFLRTHRLIRRNFVPPVNRFFGVISPSYLNCF